MAQPRSVRHRAFLDANSKSRFKFWLNFESWILNLEFWILNLKSWNLIQDSEAEAEARARNLDACVENGAPNPQKCFPNGFQSSKFWSQIGQNGPGMGTKWPRRPQMAHSRAQIRFWEILRAKNSSKMKAKMVKKSIKKPFKKTVVFRSGLGHDFLFFFTHFHFKMVPKWTQAGTKIDTKTASGRKSEFSFWCRKTNSLRGISGVRGFHFRDPKRSQIDEKTMSEFDSGFRSCFSALSSFWSPFWSQKIDSGASFSRPFLSTEKKALKPCPRGTKRTEGSCHLVP